MPVKSSTIANIDAVIDVIKSAYQGGNSKLDMIVNGLESAKAHYSAVMYGANPGSIESLLGVDSRIAGYVTEIHPDLFPSDYLPLFDDLLERSLNHLKEAVMGFLKNGDGFSEASPLGYVFQALSTYQIIEHSYVSRVSKASAQTAPPSP